MKRIVFLLAGTLALWLAVGGRSQTSPIPPGAARTNAAASSQPMKDRVVKSEAEWQRILTPQQFEVLRQKATERPFTGAYWNSHAKGIYVCAGCGQPIFASDAKFDSGCGWPSFFVPISTNVVFAQTDNSHFMHRTEILCARCGGHLGHVFDDGPPPTGLRYCINSAALKFETAPAAAAPSPPKPAK